MRGGGRGTGIQPPRAEFRSLSRRFASRGREHPQAYGKGTMAWGFASAFGALPTSVACSPQSFATLLARTCRRRSYGGAAFLSAAQLRPNQGLCRNPRGLSQLRFVLQKARERAGAIRVRRDAATAFDIGSCMLRCLLAWVRPPGDDLAEVAARRFEADFQTAGSK